ncbi:MAG: hypothetical protein DHS20C04_26250 [Hyphococcus sp.]|nr:MAG: hypothetical protein DHS20C04_26250 [Marinicaulis sp.]
MACLIAAAALTAASGIAYAQGYIALNTSATICPAGLGNQPPDFEAPECETTTVLNIDPQGRDIWVRILFDADPNAVPAGDPAGFYVSVKASSAVWLNGVYLGSNGVPGPDKHSETPGRMDAVFYAPHEAIKAGQNEAVLRLSSHHGFLHLNYPVHYLILQRYANPSREILRAYGPSLLTFGVFLLSAIYFGVSALRRMSAGSSILLFVLSLLAITQLLIETSRGLFAYNYPFQDLRLVLITAGAAFFGLCLYIHVVFKFIDKNHAAYILAGLIATALAVIIPGSFDAKALLGLGAPTLAGACITISAAVRNKPSARAYAVALSIFLAIMVIFIGRFLDATFYYSTAALLLFLIGQQAMLFAKERTLRLDANDRARRLELALEQARQKDSPERMTIHNAGKTEIIAASDIIYCKGAGDYVEIVLSSGARHLHLAKLHELESELPQTFLRVHRSYIVNTSFVRSLTREANGVGALTLNNGETVPVSRRILPNVRNALK